MIDETGIFKKMGFDPLSPKKKLLRFLIAMGFNTDYTSL
jgi:hypothetical protein